MARPWTRPVCASAAAVILAGAAAAQEMGDGPRADWPTYGGSFGHERFSRLTGLAVLSSLKSNPSTRDIPVVLLTARATDADVWRGWQSGADYYLTKGSFHDETLLKAVVDLIGEAGA